MTGTDRWPLESPAASPPTTPSRRTSSRRRSSAPGARADRYVTGKGSVRTWLLSIVHHRAIDAIRRRRPTSELPDEEEGARRPRRCRCPTSGARSSGNLDRAQVAAALATLSDVQREALELAYFGGLTQAEIAERTGVPLGTVKGRVRLALVGDAPRARRRRCAEGAAMTDRTTWTATRSGTWRRCSCSARSIPTRWPPSASTSRTAPTPTRSCSSSARRRPRCSRRAEPVEPPPALKARLLAAAEADLRRGRHPSTASGGRPRRPSRRPSRPGAARGRARRRGHAAVSGARSLELAPSGARLRLASLAAGRGDRRRRARRLERRPAPGPLERPGVPPRRRAGARPRGPAGQRDGGDPGDDGRPGRARRHRRRRHGRGSRCAGLAPTTRPRGLHGLGDRGGRARRCRWATSRRGGRDRRSRRPRRP